MLGTPPAVSFQVAVFLAPVAPRGPAVLVSRPRLGAELGKRRNSNAHVLGTSVSTASETNGHKAKRPQNRLLTGGPRGRSGKRSVREELCELCDVFELPAPLQL